MDDNVEESVVAKSTGQQEEKDMALKDTALYSVLGSKKKMTKDNAGYKELEKIEVTQTKNYNSHACIKCKFNLPDEKNVISWKEKLITNMVFQTSFLQKVMACCQEILFGIL
jgi:hypothetical protein